MPRRTRGPWIQLYYELFDKAKWAEYESLLMEGKNTKKQRRAAQDFALASVVRLYLALGRTDEGKIDYRNRGQRIQLEKWMTESGEDLLSTLDRMAECSIIHRDYWTNERIIATTNAIEQATQRAKRVEKSMNANQKKAQNRASPPE